MGALPKNKITRAERGKRRQGNRPTITKDTNQTTVPLHKRGMVAQFLKKIGIASEKQTGEKSVAKKTVAKSKPKKAATKPDSKKPAARKKPAAAKKTTAPKASKATKQKSTRTKKGQGGKK